MTKLPDESLFGDYGDWPGRDVLDSGGERLGGVREIYLDRETGQPEWVLVDVDGDEARFVPLADAAVESNRIRVAHSAEVVRNAPSIGPEPRIDQSEERQLYAHYGLGYSEEDSGSGLPSDEPPEQPSSWSEVAAAETQGEAPSEEPAASAPEPAAGYDTPGEPATTDFDTHSEPDRDAYQPPKEEPAPEPEPETSAPPAVPAAFSTSTDQPEDIVPVTPDIVPPSPPSTPAGGAPSAPEPPDVAAPSAEEAQESAPEEGGGPLAVVKSKPAAIAAGLVIAAILLMIVRRLR